MIKLLSKTPIEKFNEYSKYVLKDGFVYDEENNKSTVHSIEIFNKNELGLIIVGNSGSGKSLFFEIMQKIIHPQSQRAFAKVSVLDVVSEFDKVGSRIYEKWKRKNICFDDLGAEDIGYFMGKKVEVMEKFIMERHSLFHNHKLKTHFTTNLSESDILNRYGTRCASRLKEMCDKALLGATKKYTDRRIYRNFIGLPDVYHPIQKSQDDIIFEKKIIEAKEHAILHPPIHIKEGLGTRARKKINGGL